MSHGHDEGDEGCTGSCGADAGRRGFLRDGLMAVAAITLVAGASAPLEAMSRRYARDIAGGAAVTYDVPAQDGATIDRANKVILVRYHGLVHAFSLECPHRGTMVEWQPENARFYCPKHKSTFQPEGTRIQGKSPRSLDRFKVSVAGGKVTVDTGVVFDADADAAGWAAAGVRVG